jgi:hypothetical protein
MKTIKILLISILASFVLISCEDNSETIHTSLLGKWTHRNNYLLTLDFRDTSKVLVNGYDFKYDLSADSIEFTYNGPLLIAIEPSKHKYGFSHNRSLIIEDLDKLYFFYGDSGENVLIKGIEPNIFVGVWVSAEDSLYFIKNDKLERPHQNYNSSYTYSFTNDSLTIQYSGPNKIYLPPVTYKYDFMGDTLVVNFNKDYYPDIKSAVIKYSRYYKP